MAQRLASESPKILHFKTFGNEISGEVKHSKSLISSFHSSPKFNPATDGYFNQSPQLSIHNFASSLKKA